MGLPEGRHRRDQRGDRQRGARRSARRSGPTRPSRACSCRDGRATGVALENGDEIAAPVVVSGLDPRRTFLELVEPKELPDDLVDEHRALQVPRLVGQGEPRARRAAGLHLPARAYPAAQATLRGAFSISPSVDYLERAYDDAKYGEFSRKPYMDIVIPSMIDPGMAPPGKHVMSIFVQYAPYHLNGGWTDAKREAFGDAVIDTLARYAPNIKLAHPAPAGADAGRHRAHHRALRGQHLPGRARAAAAVLPAAGAGVGEVPHADRRATGSAARARIRAAASWARRAGSRRSRSSAGER